MNTLRRNFAITVALAALVMSEGRSQEPAPVSASASSPYTWPSPTVTTPYPTVSLPTCSAPPACADHEDNNGRLLVGDALLDVPHGPGWFVAAEVSGVGPSVMNRLLAPVTLGGVTTLVHLPTADLSWTAQPRVDMGYRLGQAWGSVLVSYRGLNTQGLSTLAAFDPAGSAASLSSHLNMTVIDIDYASQDNALGPLWDMNWRTGVRLATLFFESTAGTPLLMQHESNNFIGGGIHVALDLRRRLADTGLSFVGQVEGSGVLGRVSQLYAAAVPGVGVSAVTATANEPAPALQVGLGLDWCPAKLSKLHFSAGYLFERWWTVGETTGTQGEVSSQGVFFRGEWRY